MEEPRSDQSNTEESTAERCNVSDAAAENPNTRVNRNQRKSSQLRRSIRYRCARRSDASNSPVNEVVEEVFETLPVLLKKFEVVDQIEPEEVVWS